MSVISTAANTEVDNDDTGSLFSIADDNTPEDQVTVLFHLKQTMRWDRFQL